MSTSTAGINPAITESNAQLAEIRRVLADTSRFRPTRHNQWEHLDTGVLIEAGYVYGEPWAKVLSPDGRRTLEHYKFTGQDRTQLDTLLQFLG